jgi:hypothetical protein
MNKIYEFLILFPLFFSVKWQQIKEEWKIRKYFYINDRFRQCDQALRRTYLLSNPYRISKKFLIQKGEQEVHVYGETPLTTLAQIGKECSIVSSDYVVELGCGRGRGVFFLSHWFGCAVKGIEWIPEFVHKANEIAKDLNCLKVSFSCEDMLETDLSEASIIYLYGTCLDEFSIRKFLKCCESLVSGTKIITVSYPLTDFDPSFSLLKQFEVSYPWGTAEVFLQKKL